MVTCNPLAETNNAYLQLSNYNISQGTVVHISCKQFGHRVIGPRNVTCLNTTHWSDTTTPKCAWTGELNTYEKLVIGVTSSCIILLLICLILIISLVVYRRSRRRHKSGDDGQTKPINPEMDHGFQNHNGRYGNQQNGGPNTADYYRGQNYSNQAFEYTDPEPQYPSEMASNPSSQDAYRWNGHIPRPKLGPEGREPF